MYPDSEILFPNRCLRQLIGLRGPEWDQLIEAVAALPEPHEDSLAFSLMMIKLGSCLTCDLDSYRASLGCTTCAKRTVAGFKGSDAMLHERFEEAREEVRAYLKINNQAQLPQKPNTRRPASTGGQPAKSKSLTSKPASGRSAKAKPARRQLAKPASGRASSRLAKPASSRANSRLAKAQSSKSRSAKAKPAKQASARSTRSRKKK